MSRRHLIYFPRSLIFRLCLISSSLPAPATQSTDITTSEPSTPSLTTVLAAVPASFTSGGISPKTSTTSLGVTGLPPRPPTTRWHPKPGGEVPHAPDQYWPMVMYK